MKLHWVNGLENYNRRLDIKFGTKQEALNMFSSLMEQIDRIQGELFLGCNLTVSFGNNTAFKDFLGKDSVPMGWEKAWITYEAPVIMFEENEIPTLNLNSVGLVYRKIDIHNDPEYKENMHAAARAAAEYASAQKVSHK